MENISVGIKARTIKYEDDLGTLIFVFDVNPAQKSNGKWGVELGKKPARGISDTTLATLDKDRELRAYTSVRAWIVSKGYEIEE